MKVLDICKNKKCRFYQVTQLATDKDIFIRCLKWNVLSSCPVEDFTCEYKQITERKNEIKMYLN